MRAFAYSCLFFAAAGCSPDQPSPPAYGGSAVPTSNAAPASNAAPPAVAASDEEAEVENRIPPAILEVLENAERFELLSVDPNVPEERTPEQFHGWNVLGKTALDDAADRRRLLESLTRGVGENDGEVADCFMPVHGIRAVRNDATVELVICFECAQINVYRDGERLPQTLVTESPQPVFDELLERANVPLAPKPDAE